MVNSKKWLGQYLGEHSPLLGALLPGFTPWGLSFSVLSVLGFSNQAQIVNGFPRGFSILSSKEPLPEIPRTQSFTSSWASHSRHTDHPFLQLWPKKLSPESSYMPLETITKYLFPNLHAEIIFNKVKNNFLENNKYSTTLLSIVSRL